LFHQSNIPTKTLRSNLPDDAFETLVRKAPFTPRLLRIGKEKGKEMQHKDPQQIMPKSVNFR
jgi:hypothetical protein